MGRSCGAECYNCKSDQGGIILGFIIKRACTHVNSECTLQQLCHLNIGDVDYGGGGHVGIGGGIRVCCEQLRQK